MVGIILTLVVLVVAGWFFWHSKTDAGFDFNKGASAVAAAAVAIWAYLSDGWGALIDFIANSM